MMLSYTIKVPFNGVTDEGTLEVPDGKWVVRTWAMTCNYYHDDDTPDPESEHRHNQVVGVEPTVYKLDFSSWNTPGSRGWRSESLLVGDEPFGVVTTDSSEGDGLIFSSAQQVSGGELGRSIQITRPPIVRSATRYPQGNHSQRRKKQAGWVRLEKLAELAGLSPLKVVQQYFAFTDQRQPQLHIVQGDVALVKSREWHSRQCDCIPAHELTNDRWAEIDIPQTWVRLGWATRVLQMRTLGYTPEQYLYIPLAA